MSKCIIIPMHIEKPKQSIWNESSIIYIKNTLINREKLISFWYLNRQHWNEGLEIKKTILLHK